MAVIKASEVKIGDRLQAELSPAVVTRVLAGDHSPFARDTGARFWHPEPITIYFTIDGEKGLQVFGADEEIALAESASA